MLFKVPDEISVIRENKDLSDDESVLIAEVDKYAELLDEILDIRQKIYDIFG